MVTDLVGAGFPVNTLRTGAVVLDLLFEVELERFGESGLDGTPPVPDQKGEHWSIHRQLSPRVLTEIQKNFVNFFFHDLSFLV